MRSLIFQVVLWLAAVVVVRPALAQPSALLAPPPPESPAPEGGLAAGQIAVGALTTVGAGLALALLGSAAGGPTLAVVGAIGGPGLAGWAICGVGRTSRSYEGGCGPSVGAGYLGAIALGVPLGFLGAATIAPHVSDGGTDRVVGASIGVFVGVVVGTAVGATIGWHLSKRRRGHAEPPRPAPPVPRWSPDGMSELRQRTFAPPAGLAVNVPLLAFQF